MQASIVFSFWTALTIALMFRWYYAFVVLVSLVMGIAQWIPAFREDLIHIGSGSHSWSRSDVMNRSHDLVRQVRELIRSFPFITFIHQVTLGHAWILAAFGVDVILYLWTCYVKLIVWMQPTLHPPQKQWILNTDELPSVRRPRSRKNSYDNLPEHLAQQLDIASKKVSPKTMNTLIKKCVRNQKYKEYMFSLQTDSDVDGLLSPSERDEINNQLGHFSMDRALNVFDQAMNVSVSDSSDNEDYDDFPQRSPLNSPAPLRYGETIVRSSYLSGAQRFLMESAGTISKVVYGVDPDWVIKLTEDCLLLSRLLIKARDMEDRVLAVTVFTKLQTSRSLTLQMSEKLIAFLKDTFRDEHPLTIQTEDVIKLSRNILDKFDEARESKLWRKVHKFLMYGLTMSLFSRAGISLDSFNYTKMEQEGLKKKFHLGPDFVRTCLDTILFICERGQQVYLTGDASALFHSGEEYSGWFNKALELKRNAQFMSNPEAHGLNIFEFIASLGECIEQGAAILRHSKRLNSLDARLYGKTLEDLRLISAEFMTKRKAMQDRKAPFAVLVSGPTSVNKSGFTKLLYYHYGKLFGLDTGSEFKYTRNSIDNFWVNFNSYQWCVILDDIAFLKPEAAPQGDPTLLEMLQVINNVPFVPIQAALEDKGRTPLLSRLVIATTNTMHLNVHAYFSCPAAIQRRLPWVFDVKVKPHFQTPDGRFDTSAARAFTLDMADGEYPNFWIIDVYKVQVRGTAATHELVCSFDQIYDFIQWYSERAIEYELTQDSAMEADRKMGAAFLCEACRGVGRYTPCSSRPGDCLAMTMQTGEKLDLTCYRPGVYSQLWSQARGHIQREAKAIAMEKIREERIRATPTIWILIMYWLYIHTWFCYLIDFLLGKDYMVTKLKSHLWHEGFGRRYMRRLGSRVQRTIGTKSFLLKIAGLIVAGIMVKKCYDFFSTSYHFKMEEKKKTSTSGSRVQVSETWLDNAEETYMNNGKARSPMRVQGIVQSVESSTIGRRPEPKGDEKPNVWYKEDYETTTFEISPKSVSWKALKRDKLEEILSRNMVRFHLKNPEVFGDERERYPVNGVCLGGQVYITNNHALPLDYHGTPLPEFDLVVRMLGQGDGVTGKVTLKVTQDMIRRFPNLDLAVMTLQGLPPRKKLAPYFPENTIQGNHRGFYIGRNENGDVVTFDLDNVNLSSEQLNRKINGEIVPLTDSEGNILSFKVWKGFSHKPTVRGDCGMLMVSQSAMGPVLLGIHNAGRDFTNEISAAPLYRGFVEELVKNEQPFCVQDGSPMLSTKTIQHALGALHPMSPLRWIEEGTGLVYGSLNCHQATMKSRVRETILCESMKRRGFDLKYTRPHLHGWRPKRVQLLEMTKPASKINPSLLKQVRDDFLNDILSGLKQEDLDELFVYDDFTAVNGAAGVAYVDKMKRSTSAGFPWKHSKKYHYKLIPPEHGLQDPIEFEPEIMERVSKMIETYLDGYRVYPVNDACFKDEPVKHAKREAFKTRIFAASPVDYSILVRKYTLAFTRLFYQKHFLFESAPGIDATSPQWGILFNYLTQHGKDRMVAGDYAFYDKTMFALTIIHAFSIIIEVCRRGKFSDDDVQVLHGISIDTAFPLYNMFGDIIEFFGTLPSGHPLTVIINSLANCLYMRYCYAFISPDKNAKNFKRDVSLMTYGDDNIMGVSPNCPWFNHTAIMNVLTSIGITYTMADKEQESVPYIHIDECTFLKRSWRWEDAVGNYCAPLPMDSIVKRLMIGVESKSETRQRCAINCIRDSIADCFHHGEEVFNSWTSTLKEIVEECGLQLYVEDNTFMTWSQCVESFLSREKGAADCFQ